MLNCNAVPAIPAQPGSAPTPDSREQTRRSERPRHHKISGFTGRIVGGLLALTTSVAIAGCDPAQDGGDQDDPTANECNGGKCDSIFGRTTDEVCDAVDPRWGENWELPDETGDKQRHVTDAMACANRRYWATQYNNPLTVHTKYYLHKAICDRNPASHFAMNGAQREFYCSISLHLRMCNTQGLYAIKDRPDSLPRRERDNEVFAACLQLSGELEHFKTALYLDDAEDEEAARVVARLYDEYRVQPGIRVPPAAVNPGRAAFGLFERLARIAYYGITVPIEMLETSFSSLFLNVDPLEHRSQVELILRYRKNLQDWNGEDLLDASTLPICGDGSIEPGEECDDGNTAAGDGCTSYCAME